ncbi:hypothetical protein [Gloeobacter kilaueensis]|uniref:Uncharacterized protein n=1 Tax=Gloeobacter kilaueensis (strain ATCC BAA-2537 / CCAP 1431/1 / ULC 316 / JS1) TaxID=1183438 RepID=U5QCG6_GLOK1|nr:hypothetical protein [Gloeobacter kilaueensis]AGY56607.1 hypothetical protein GKIL_0360 [Gloeobacter kilaueensis JS1]
MLSLLLQIGLVLVVLAVLGVAFKILVLPLALLAGLVGFVLHNALPIAIVGGIVWWIASKQQKRLPGA